MCYAATTEGIAHIESRPSVSQVIACPTLSVLFPHVTMEFESLRKQYGPKDATRNLEGRFGRACQRATFRNYPRRIKTELGSICIP